MVLDCERGRYSSTFTLKLKSSPQSSEETIESIIHEVVTKCVPQAKEIEDICPCTALQTLLVVGQLRDDGNYLTILSFESVKTPHDPNTFEAACKSLRSRTLILRTRLVDFQSANLQVVSRRPLSSHTNTGLKASLHVDKDKLSVLVKEAVRFR